MNILFYWVGGATFVLQVDNIKIACDPVLCPKGTKQNYGWFTSTRLNDPVYNETTFKDISIWLITHAHEDHLDKQGFSVIDKQGVVITNKTAFNSFVGFSDVTKLEWGQTKVVRRKNYEISIRAIKAIHGINPISAYFAGNVNGYFLKIKNTITGEVFSCYISGDTVYKRKIAESLKDENIGLFIPNMGAAKKGSLLMNLTLDAAMLKSFISDLNPKYTIPVHWETFSHYNEGIQKTVDLKIPNLIVLKPGESKLLSSKIGN